MCVKLHEQTSMKETSPRTSGEKHIEKQNAAAKKTYPTYFAKNSTRRMRNCKRKYNTTQHSEQTQRNRQKSQNTHKN